MSVTVTLPDVAACDATGCAYNVGRRCHARAITIGHATHPMCDTFLPDIVHVQPQPIAGVGACKVANCVHNRDRCCEAPSIRVAVVEGKPDCTTFRQR